MAVTAACRGEARAARPGDRGSGSCLERQAPGQEGPSGEVTQSKVSSRDQPPGRPCSKHVAHYHSPVLTQHREKKVKDREVKQLAQGHTARRWWSALPPR